MLASLELMLKKSKHIGGLDRVKLEKKMQVSQAVICTLKNQVDQIKAIKRYSNENLGLSRIDLNVENSPSKIGE